MSLAYRFPASAVLIVTSICVALGSTRGASLVKGQLGSSKGTQMLQDTLFFAVGPKLPPVRDHPRLIASEDDLSALKQTVAQDPNAGKMYAAAHQFADEIISKRQNASNSAQLNPGRFLDQWGRVITLAMLYRMTENTTIGEQGVFELLGSANGRYDGEGTYGVCTRPNWGQPTYLEVAAYTYMVAVGYDWLQKVMPAGNQTAVVECLLQKSINSDNFPKYAQQDQTNRNIVTNGCFLLGALAILGDTDPATHSYVEEMIYNSSVNMNTALNMYHDGGWWEGFVYWGYATFHTLSVLLSVEVAFGSDFGMRTVPGLNTTGDFFTHMYGGSGYNYDGSVGPADYNWAAAGEDNIEYADTMVWFNKAFPSKRSAFVARQAVLHHANNGTNYTGSGGRYPAFALLFWDTQGTPADLAAMPLDRIFANESVAVMRTDWTNTRAFLGMKGGATYFSHNHRDLGSFVYDAEGQRWAHDLGLEDYGIPRPTYRTEVTGHNTVVFNGLNQAGGDNYNFCAPVRQRYQPDHPYPTCRVGYALFDNFTVGQKCTNGVVDLDWANNRSFVANWKRGAALVKATGTAIIRDEFNVTQLCRTNVTWQFHTNAHVSLRTLDGGGTVVTLAQGGKTVTVNAVVAPAGAAWVSEQVNLEAPLLPDPNLTRVSLVLPMGGTSGIHPGTSVSLVVAMGPHAETVTPGDVAVLDEWPQGPSSTLC
eukprot:m.81420 g.81420  ORF g.81420 m.81420 type:complete len:706 (+) comp16318_c0_seq22:196-2313(+)